MGSDTIWIIGSNMTRFGKHPDKDVVDLAAEASREALKDAGISLSEVGVLGVGNLMNAGAGIGQQLQKPYLLHSHPLRMQVDQSPFLT